MAVERSLRQHEVKVRIATIFAATVNSQRIRQPSAVTEIGYLRGLADEIADQLDLLIKIQLARQRRHHLDKQFPVLRFIQICRFPVGAVIGGRPRRHVA